MKTDIDPTDLVPDIYALEEEWRRQASLCKSHYDHLADLRRDYDQAKQAAEELEAEVSLDVRRFPSKYGIDKVTEATVEAATTLDMRVREAKREALKTKHAVAKKEATVSALEHKKKALEKCVDLWLSGYYSEPKARSKEGRERIEQMERDKAFAPSGRYRGDE